MYECTLCGQKLEFLSDFHAQQHNMTLEEYKQKNIAKKVRFGGFRYTKSYYREGDIYTKIAMTKIAIKIRKKKV